MKTEKQKAAEGLLYDANNDPQLQQEMLETRCLLHEYNLLPPDRGEERDRLIRRIVNMGEGGCIISPFYCDYGYHIHIGKNFFANTNLVILDGADVSIGDNVFIAPNVGIYTAGHPLDVEQRNAGLEYAYPIRIGNNVWIGGNVVILPGVSIGDGAVIGAGSVVTKDIPAHTVAVGNPCRVMRSLTPNPSPKERGGRSLTA
ncbi:putative thiogalactoside transacetylase [Bacteroides sp. CAG:633]|uniref:sugar O-acetyltransferase n=1 Tax=Bacteroides sp. CAG:633 TaxID=1262744 RepID=UPI000337F62E|nr:sugar O-acetyltransferase [Bacteroides sp. CAG:633]CDB10536.1 putative thiogalactoside transacetylase [Bacteroides sp. CAG:633]